MESRYRRPLRGGHTRSWRTVGIFELHVRVTLQRGLDVACANPHRAIAHEARCDIASRAERGDGSLRCADTRIEREILSLDLYIVGVESRNRQQVIKCGTSDRCVSCRHARSSPCTAYHRFGDRRTLQLGYRKRYRGLVIPLEYVKCSRRSSTTKANWSRFVSLRLANTSCALRSLIC